jgi:hypothetical protein
METTMAPVHPWVAEGARRVRFGLNTTALPDWGATRDFVQTADALGFDAFMMPDHPAALPSGTWTTLAALATGGIPLKVSPPPRWYPRYRPAACRKRSIAWS